MFRNTISPIIGYNLYPVQQHYFTQLFTQITPGSIFVLYLIGLILVKLVTMINGCRSKGVSVVDMVTIEVLDPFYSMIKTKDREFWFREEVGCRERLGIKRIQPRNFLQLVFAGRNTKGRRLRSVHNYDILSNPFYADKFLYVPNSYDGREDYIISEYADPWLQQYSSDICRIALYLAYLPKSVALELEFDEVSIFKTISNLRRKYVEDV